MELEDLPGGAVLAARMGSGIEPWPKIAYALEYCTWFPSEEVRTLLADGDFDVRWPLTFAAWYLRECGASVDQPCLHFLSAARLLDQAFAVLSEYTGSEWLSAWRSIFEERARSARCA